MADSLCKFLDGRCITGSQFFATYFSAQKPFLFPTLVRRKRRRKSLHIAFCSTPISTNLDVVSTHEHSDGTLLFRFGDPREIAKEDELEEPLLDSEEEFSVVKVLDGDNEREVIVKKVEREARGEAVTVVTDAGVSESVVIGNGRNDLVEVETGLSKNFLGDSAVEIGSFSPEGIQNESVAEVDIENAVHVEEIFEKKDDSEASVPPPPENSITSLEVEEEMMGQTSDESFEELDDDKSLVLSSPTAMPVYSDLVNTKEIEEFEGEGSSQLTENDGDKDCCYDSTHSKENGAASADIEAAHNDIEIVQQIEQISENIGSILEGSTESVPEGINLGNAKTVADEISPENAPEGINLGNTETVGDEISPDNAPEGINLGNTEAVVDEISSDNAPEGIDKGNTETVVDEISSDNSPEGNDQGNTETVVDEISLENSLDGIDLGNTETVVDEISLEKSLDGIDLGNTETVVDEISLENSLNGIDLGNTETVVDEISLENSLDGIDLGNTGTVVDEISLQNSLDGIDLGNTETVVDEINLENSLDGIDLGNTETVVDEISLKNSLDGIDLGNTETVVEEISLENFLDGIDLGNTETVIDEISLENSLDGIDLGNTETVVDEISLENAPDGLDLGNSETFVDKISPENALGGINLGNTETVVDEISPENVDIRHLSMDAEDQSIEVLNFENDEQTELSNLSVDTEDQASRNSTFKDSDVTEVMPDSPKLEAEPVFDEEVDHNIISESNESESPLPSDENLPSLSLEEERKEDVENNEIMEVYGHEVVEDKSSEVLVSSKEATPAAAELILSSGATLLQYPSKAFAGGHEAYFIACGKWLGVADAVGSWSLEGSDPGVYAQELMQNSQSIVSQCDKDSINDPKQVLNLSVSKTDSPGSSTVLIAHFDGKALHVANIGDSGFIIVRNGNVYRKSSPMLHEFNLPIQIEKGDDPYQLLEEYKIELDEGDIIVTATDALFDNLYDQEIVSIASRSLEADKSPQEIAEILATRVQQVGSSASGRSPFADAAQAAGYVGYTGGKRDDVAAIVSVVQKVIVSNNN
ncbi:probable protein phosphatase 2C 62 isoform X1 [Solanum lycopersicum]|uniref:probable protein phosphatase 2C 62 isoform X1 n=1 Tax=Solanum lycopersicum TaxID=4081 RepID=UPI0002768D7C|nr:probable protein phosphatase 2C 62 isoform X1 [Solanum lycopersicum]